MPSAEAGCGGPDLGGTGCVPAVGTGFTGRLVSRRCWEPAPRGARETAYDSPAPGVQRPTAGVVVSESAPWGLGVLVGEGQGREERSASAWSWLGLGACDMEVPCPHSVSFRFLFVSVYCCPFVMLGVVDVLESGS